MVTDYAMTPKRRFLAGLFGGRVDRVPVGSPTWVATVECMDACGACFPEVHQDGEKMARLAATAYTILGYDCIMPIYRVHQESAALGAEMDWAEIDRMPVARTHPWRTPDMVDIPSDFLERPAIKAVLEALSILRRTYPHVAIVGKVMGPWTLSYNMHGTEDFLIKTILEPETVRAFLDRMKHITVLFAQAQFAAGADIICLADHATGDLISPKGYRDFLLPVHQELTQAIGGPLILHICGNTADRMDYICHTGFDAFHFDSKVDAAKATAIVNKRISLVGNINNPEILFNGTPEQSYERARHAIQAGVDIVGPECAIPLRTSNQNLLAIRQAALDCSAVN